MRIIAGKFRGLKLNTFEYENVRPTLDKVRESIFNKIQFGINGSTFLDLFSGTGVFSIEAFSRGASVVYAIDNNANSIKLINLNLKKAKISSGIEVVNSDYKTALIRLADKNIKFDYIFLDPPFSSDFGDKAIDKILELNVLNENGMIIYEHAIDKPYKENLGLTVVDEKKSGTILVTYLKRG